MSQTQPDKEFGPEPQPQPEPEQNLAAHTAPLVHPLFSTRVLTLRATGGRPRVIPGAGARYTHPAWDWNWNRGDC